jgi:hypothetical protein
MPAVAMIVLTMRTDDLAQNPPSTDRFRECFEVIGAGALEESNTQTSVVVIAPRPGHQIEASAPVRRP